MFIILKEETNNSSIVAALHPNIPTVSSKTPPIPSPHVPTPELTIAAAAVVTLADAFQYLYTKVKSNSILNRK